MSGQDDRHWDAVDSLVRARSRSGVGAGGAAIVSVPGAAGVVASELDEETGAALVEDYEEPSYRR